MSLTGRKSALLSLSALLCAFVGQTAFAQQSVAAAPLRRIVRDISGSEVKTLPSSVSSWARTENDYGRIASARHLDNLSMVFTISDTQQRALDKLLKDQQNRWSQYYHKWLTPETYGKQFGMNEADLDKASQWLKAQGFTVKSVAPNRMSIAFAGSVAQVESAFSTEIHSYEVNGELHFANSTPISLPSALGEVVLEVHNLHDFRPKPQVHGQSPPDVTAKPYFTSSKSGNHFVSPADFAVIYNVKSLYDRCYDGTGQTIGVIGQHSISSTDIDHFRSAAGLGSKRLITVPVDGKSTSSSDDEVESDLDVEWTGAVAKNATIVFAYAGSGNGAFDAWTYLINNKANGVYVPVISVSYGDCESNVGQSTADAYRQYAQQANSQGQTTVAASGDNGATGCDYNVSSATQGLVVDFPADLPEVTGIGGTRFSDGSGTYATDYWFYDSGTADSGAATAKGYIPEIVWNETTDTNNSTGDLAAGGGGKSAYYAKPSWQTGTGVPGDGKRDVPDVSLNAAVYHDGTLICSSGYCTNGFRDSSNSGYLDAIGGTSVGAPAFSGLVALLNQATASSGQGNLNSNLYSVASSAPGSIHDITSGDNKQPCTKGTTDCSSGGNIGYSAGTGYDLATGLGSVNGYNLVTHWPSYSAGADYTLTDGGTGISITAAGQSGSVEVTISGSNGFSGDVSLTCTPPSSAGLSCSLDPTSVTLSGTQSSQTTKLTVTTSKSGAISGGTVSQNKHTGTHLGLVGGGFALGVVLFGGSARRRRWSVLTGLLVCIAMAGVGCGGGSSSKSSGSGSGGTSAGTYSITVQGLSGSVTRTYKVDVTVK